PTSNYSKSIQAQKQTIDVNMVDDDDNDDDDDDGVTKENQDLALEVARDHARLYGLGIKESSRGGLGLFAVEAMKPEDSPPMVLMGSFVVCDLLQLGQAM
ncbi:unnamed protein product, partial [Sphacelaria rigidula]